MKATALIVVVLGVLVLITPWFVVRPPVPQPYDADAVTVSVSPARAATLDVASLTDVPDRVEPPLRYQR